MGEGIWLRREAALVADADAWGRPVATLSCLVTAVFFAGRVIGACARRRTSRERAPPLPCSIAVRVRLQGLVAAGHDPVAFALAFLVLFLAAGAPAGASGPFGREEVLDAKMARSVLAQASTVTLRLTDDVGVVVDA